TVLIRCFPFRRLKGESLIPLTLLVRLANPPSPLFLFLVEWWDGQLQPKHSSKEWDSLWPSKRKKPPLVSGPYIVYMLRDIDIMEDWTAIKKAKAAVSPPKRKLEGPLKAEKLSSPPLFSAHCEDGHLHYEGEVYVKGQSIFLQVGDEAPVQAVITAISTGEVWLRREDGSKTKIYVSQLQKGKYSVHKA
ncbi:breast cancer metastasis-suppressor 1-like protein, partial [Python bivittatus]|uniref:Breast cancer metastasis-suppressor 1-like protein n=1 Tax=Python bivittatus TaxID=176946 RepID=A0A9F2R953_PYTBI